jgi:hypothetical protein
MSSVHAIAPTYELHSLGWKAFQQLCLSVVSEVWGQTVQGFFDSRDGGRDGAFYGTWTSREGEIFEGSFTVQCKFSQSPGRGVNIASLADELDKAARLTSRGLADNYFLFTNMQLTGVNDEAIRAAFEAIPGLIRCQIYGAERISQFIRESPRLRMLVPRVYGLGDLGHILDGRAYDQAQEILSSLGDDMNKFVMTDAFRASARAVVDHGFVLLLGEPACGKSAIAAALALGALDEWNCFTVKVRNPSEFVAVSNPYEKQFFWVDDAFGATQVDWQITSQWNATFPHIRAALRRGAKFAFTSRDYIYKNAHSLLKESALPVMQDSQVIIRVEQLSKDEREQILYNHIRLGTQSTTFKRRLKPYLEDVAAHKRFSPEIARRLGNPTFTKHLSISAAGLDDFVERPVQLLQEVIRTLDAASRAAIALVFMRGGWLASPVSLLPEEESAIELLGATGAEMRAALAPLGGSLLIQVQQKSQIGWRAKHPTVLDAFASLVAEDRELMDIYLTGTPVRRLLSEVACGGRGIAGVKVEVPDDRYDALIRRIQTILAGRWEDGTIVDNFLAYRCGKDFLRTFLELNPNFVGQLYVGSYFDAMSSIRVINKLHEVGLLREDERIKHAATVRELAVQTPDAGFLEPRIVSFLTKDEIKEILHDIRNQFVPFIGVKINSWTRNYSDREDPESYFEPFKGALSSFSTALAYDAVAVKMIEEGLAAVDEAIAELESDREQVLDCDEYRHVGTTRRSEPDLRSIFDDVDE